MVLVQYPSALPLHAHLQVEAEGYLDDENQRTVHHNTVAQNRLTERSMGYCPLMTKPLNHVLNVYLSKKRFSFFVYLEVLEGFLFFSHLLGSSIQL